MRPSSPTALASLCAALVVALGLTLASPAAARQPQEFKPGQELTAEELELQKQRSKSSLHSFTQEMEEKPKPFPWKAVTLLGIVIAVVTPLALRAYKRTAVELASRKSE